jgi:hypothetical protein
MAALIAWAKTSLVSDVHGIGPLRSAALMLQFISAFIVLHLFEILLWAGSYRWLCFSSWEALPLLLDKQRYQRDYGDAVPPRTWRTLGPVGSLVGVLMCELSASFLFAIRRI